MEKLKIDNLEVSKVSQSIYDNFNNFILSEDKRVFNKLISRVLLYHEVKDIPGDIVECGVFKGTGIYTFLKLKNLYNSNSSKKVIGFDFFNSEELINSIASKKEKESMQILFSERSFKHEKSFKNDFAKQIIQNGFLNSDFELIEGDISITTKEFSEKNPGFKISLLYMDVDLEAPTYNALNNLWSNITKGGLIIFDEYGYHKWSESKGVDKFIEEKNIEIKCLNYACPTAYIKKY
jgi:hypothetical protein